MSIQPIPDFALNDGSTIPQIGLGIFGPNDASAADTVATALKLGYRSLDTAEQYQNETGVGEGIRRSGVPRGEIYVTTKLGNESHGYDAARRGFEGSLKRLGLDYVDLFLIHWPMTKIGKYVESWRALERLQEEGLAKSIGVANFQIHHLDRLMAESNVVPAVNQIELHPGLHQAELKAFNTSHSIATMAWSPLAGNPFANRKLTDSPVLRKIGAKYGKTAAQVIIRWHLDQGNVVIPKTVSPDRMIENTQVFDFQLEETDLAEIAALEVGIRNPYDPDLMD
ncbi:aldo/keto reductase [Arthrobacter bambusae]|uniref:aldo/keto reductase n=1 Tax=Arthrobacter sp. efr-133-R2A-120 TaxID=3040277 RepID=UPI00254D8BE3|nr:aldo/keto reductase [Arthrobacter sp. efr-133-R2A-120]